MLSVAEILAPNMKSLSDAKMVKDSAIELCNILLSSRKKTDIRHVTNLVIQTLNSVRAREPNRRLFKELLQGPYPCALDMFCSIRKSVGLVKEKSKVHFTNFVVTLSRLLLKAMPVILRWGILTDGSKLLLAC